jgi:hypothetical protein
MKTFMSAAGVAFAIALAVVIGFRISADAMAVIIGIVCGVLASIPTSIILVWVLRQRDRQMMDPQNPYRMGHFPPVVVVNGQGTHGNGSSFMPPMLTGSNSMPHGSRDFKVVGQENTETTGDLLPSFWD